MNNKWETKLDLTDVIRLGLGDMDSLVGVGKWDEESNYLYRQLSTQEADILIKKKENKFYTYGELKANCILNDVIYIMDKFDNSIDIYYTDLYPGDTSIVYKLQVIKNE